ncbi:MAG: putative zinc-binding protein [Candidatus Bathyarchaeia archaeon]
MEGEKVPRIALFYCSGCMASVGALTVTASLEAFKRLQNEDVGLFCLSAIANEVPKHRKTTENAKILVSIDGCGNQCTTNILRAYGFEPNRQLNLVKDLRLKKIGPFKPFDYTHEEFEMVVNKIIEICEENLTKEEKQN